MIEIKDTSILTNISAGECIADGVFPSLNKECFAYFKDSSGESVLFAMYGSLVNNSEGYSCAMAIDHYIETAKSKVDASLDPANCFDLLKEELKYYVVERALFDQHGVCSCQ